MISTTITVNYLTAFQTSKKAKGYIKTTCVLRHWLCEATFARLETRWEKIDQHWFLVKRQVCASLLITGALLRGEEQARMTWDKESWGHPTDRKILCREKRESCLIHKHLDLRQIIFSQSEWFCSISVATAFKSLFQNQLAVVDTSPHHSFPHLNSTAQYNTLNTPVSIRTALPIRRTDGVSTEQNVEKNSNQVWRLLKHYATIENGLGFFRRR